MSKDFICIVCPRGCHINVDDNKRISGNMCKRGELYVLDEMNNPRRTLTSTVRTVFKNIPIASIKTDKPIPKNQIKEAMEFINKILIHKEMCAGDILVQNFLNTDSNLILTKDVRKDNL